MRFEKPYFIFLILSVLWHLPVVGQTESCNNHYDLNEDVLIDRLACIENKVALPYNRKVKGFIEYFIIRDRAYTTEILSRQSIYFPIFEEILAAHNMPDELKYLAVVESGLRPEAQSPAKAVGMWQFMYSTGKMYGLEADYLIDDRMDPYLATEAACKYLKSLYNMFNDWPLALAAYNCGPGNVRKAIRRSGYKKDFWEVYDHLPRETRSYMPQFIAISYTFNYAEEHLLFPNKEPVMPKFENVEVNQNLNLTAFSESLGICEEDLRKLNPQLKRDLVPDYRKHYKIRVPKYVDISLDSSLDKALTFGSKQYSIQTIQTTRVDPQSPAETTKVYHLVKQGDVLGKIAEQYHVGVNDIRRWNNLSSNTIKLGQKLQIYTTHPVSGKSSATLAHDLPASKFYEVKSGDSLWLISKKFEGLSVEKIKQLNNLKSNTIKPGQTLRLI